MRYIIGSDEVGYGAWAGPLFVCAAVVPESWRTPPGLKDSKQLDAFERAALYGEHLQQLPMSIMVASNTFIDEVGVKKALMDTHAEAIKTLLHLHPDAEIIIDGVLLPDGLPARTRCVPKADNIFPVVSAASVIAKVNRDFVMHQYHEQFPHYGWKTNVGYGTNKHMAGLKLHGISPLHRRSYAPIRKLLEEVDAHQRLSDT
jgi:ribonuclease HII